MNLPMIQSISVTSRSVRNLTTMQDEARSVVSGSLTLAGNNALPLYADGRIGVAPGTYLRLDDVLVLLHQLHSNMQGIGTNVDCALLMEQALDHVRSIQGPTQ